MSTKKIKILEIVEDERQLLKVLASQFDRHEIKVITAENGEEGLKMAWREHPDLILLDLLMPKMDGLTMLKCLRQDDWGKIVPVIILTVLKDDEHLTEAMALGSIDYWVKSDNNLKDIVAKVRARLLLK